MVGILVLAFAVRAAPLTQNRFHPDEAWYAHFARLIASERDPWLTSVIVDKPPLPFYLSAASLMSLAPIPRVEPLIAEVATRLPSLASGILSIALLYQFASKIYGPGTALVASMVFTLSPLSIQFSTTLFADTMLTAFLLCSLWSISRQSFGTSGIAFALALACKQTAVFFLPLVLMVGLISSLPAKFHRTGWAKPMLRWLLPVLLGLAAVSLWDIIRQPEIGFWEKGYADNNPHRLIRSTELKARFSELSHLAYYFTASHITNTLLLAGSVVLTITACTRRDRNRTAMYDLLMLGFCLAYLATYWLLAFNLWDRYLVPLVPILSLILARIALQATLLQPKTSTSRWQHRAPLIIAGMFMLTLLPHALQAADSRHPIGGDQGAYDGIEKIAAVLHALPEGAVLYDHWLSWQWSFYLFDSRTYLAWVSRPDVLTADLQAHGHYGERYFVAPAWESFSEIRTAIRSAGFRAVPHLTTIGRSGKKTFTLYHLVNIDP